MISPYHLHRLARLLACTLAMWIALAPAAPAGALAAPHQKAQQPASTTPAAGLTFIPNVGQAPPSVAFQSRGPDGSLVFSTDGVAVVPQQPDASAPDARLAAMQARQAGRVLVAPQFSQSPPAMLRIQFDGANQSPEITGLDPQASVYHYYAGNDPAQWRTFVPTYAGIVYHNLYDGIDLRYDGGAGHLKGTYVVAPHADPARIGWRYDGADRVDLDPATGALRITMPALDRNEAAAAGLNGSIVPSVVITEEAPIAWQDIAGQRRMVDVRYQLAGDSLAFAVGEYDPDHALVIDPTLLYGGYLAYANRTYGNDIATDSQGNVYVAGMTTTPFFYYGIAPVFGMGGPKSCHLSTYCPQAFLLKLSSSGGLIYLVEYGGAYHDKINAIRVAADGGVLAVGNSYSPNLPTPGGLHTDPNPGSVQCFQSYINTNPIFLQHGGSKFPRGDGSVEHFNPCESFLLRFNTDGTLAYGTYSGIGAGDEALDVDSDSQGNVWVAGRTFVWQVSADGSQELFLSDLGLGGASAFYGIAVDSQDNAWVTGLIAPAGGNPTPPQAFLLKLGPDHHLIRFRSIGGSDYDAAFGLALDGSDNAYITGVTCSPEFPALVYNGSPAQGAYGGQCDAFVQKYTPGMDLDYSTFLGGSGQDAGLAIDVTGVGEAVVTGYTTASVENPTTTDFPAVASLAPFTPYQNLFDPVNCPGGGCYFDNMVQAFVTKVHTSGSRFLLSSFLGGNVGTITNVVLPSVFFSARDYGQAVAVDPSGKIWVTGVTYADDFPLAGNPVWTSMAAYGPQGFLAKIDDNDLPVIFIPGISASELDRQDTGAESWLAIGGIHHEELALYPERNNPQMFAPDVLRRIMAGPIPLNDLSRLTYSFFINFMQGAGYREYDVARDPNRRTYAGCDLTQRTTTAPNFFVFAYDWRRPNAETAQLLRQYVRCVQEFFPGRKINIVAHSMGSMVARRYILDFGADSQINAVITVGGPLLGGPKLLYVLETGDFVDFVARSTLKDMIASFTAAHEIIPGPTWLDLGGLFILTEEFYDLDGNGSGVDVFSYPQLIKLIDERYGSSAFQPGSAGRAFRTYQNAIGAQDDWRNDRSGVKYFHIYGVKSVPDSVGQVIAGKETKCNDLYQCDDFLRIRTRMVLGDGTVPELSAGRTSTQGNYNAPNAVLAPCVSPNSSYDNNVEHTALMSNPVVNVTIREFLQRANGGSAQPLPDPTNCGLQVNTHGPQAAAERQPATAGLRHDVQLSGAVSLVISDTLGNSTLPISNTVKPGVVPGATLLATGDASYQVVLAGEGDFNVTFVTTSEPLAIAATWHDGAAISQATRYRDLVLPAGRMARLSLSAGAPASLAVDEDGNGAFETTVPPAAVASGAAAGDGEPPVITAQFSEAAGRGPQSPNLLSVNLAAEDPGSGVQGLFYSLDGQNYQPVTGPIPVDPDMYPVVYAFADDQLANRAPARAFYLPNAGKPDLALAMSHPGPVPADGVLEYTLAVANAGGSEAAGPVSLVDSLPLGASLLSASGAGWTCSPGAGTVNCTHPGPVAAGGGLPDLLLSVHATPAAAPAAINEATVSAAGDWNPANDYALDQSAVQPLVDLALAMEHSPVFPLDAAGVYTLTVANLGAAPVAGAVAVTDTLPTGLTFSGFGGEGWNCAANGQEVVCGNGAPLAGNGATLPALALTVTIDSQAMPAATNTATVAAPASFDTDPGNNDASDVTPIDTPADLSLYKTHTSGENPRPFQVGASDYYDLYVSNGGPASADGPITVVDTLPAGLTYAAASGDGWSCSAAGQEVTCDHPGPLPAYSALPGLQVTVDIGLGAPAVVTNTASVSFTGFDPVAANDTWQDPTSVRFYADAGVAKTHAGNFTAGAAGEYTISVTNYGPDPTLGGVEITDNLPAGMTLAGFSGAGWTCTAVPFGSSDYVSCANPGSQAPGGSYDDLTLAVDVSAGSPSQVTNTVYVFATGSFDTNPDNDFADDATTVDPPPPPLPLADLSVGVLTVTPEPAVQGQPIDLSLFVFNAGPDVSPNTTLTAVLPPGVDFASVSPASGSCSAPPAGQPGDVVCNLGSIASQDSRLVFLSGVASAAPHTSVTMLFTVDGDKDDPNGGNNSAIRLMDVTPVPCRSLADGNWHAAATWSCGRVPLAGDDVQIGHRVALDAPGEATNVRIDLDGELAAENSATLHVHGNWTNSAGLWTPGAGTVVFDRVGTARLRLPLVVGGVETFCHVHVAAPTLLDTGDDALATGPGCAATVDGAVRRSAPFTPADTTTPATLVDGLSRDSVRIVQASGSNDLALVRATVVAHQAPPSSLCGGSPVPGTPVLRTFDVDAFFQSDVQATLRLAYHSASEANGVSPGSLKVYHCEDGAWTALPGPVTVGVDGAMTTVEVAGVTSFSPFALAQPAPLAVTLSNFAATPLTTSIHVTWETTSELNNAGFNLYRGSAATAPDELLGFTPSQSPGSGQGAVYAYDDQAVTPGETTWYWLEAVDLDGATTLYGPISAIMAAPTAVQLTGLRASSAPGQPTWLPGVAGAAVALAVAVSWRRLRAAPGQR